MMYTAQVLSIVCPKCQASVGGKCLTKNLFGHKYLEDPHQERIDASKGKE